MSKYFIIIKNNLIHVNQRLSPKNTQPLYNNTSHMSSNSNIFTHQRRAQSREQTQCVDQEQQLLVGSQSPQVGRANLLGSITHGTNINHSFQPQHTSQLSSLVRISSGMNPSNGSLECANGSLEVREWTNRCM